ncbi:NlpC/P60 family protein [Porcincola intestinalis]|uniref:NlpC/P60 family protein n=1 Tax=Porcincola intestinalis TaxID=2606632 RepID=UPI002A91A0D0|nr:NlpC/P60 family protein [Porcincola intestinalis]MDY5580256.1 NlpC/P60 family protein [Porcincola intestinalis]
MNKAMAKAVAFCLAAGLTFTGTGAAVYAGGGDVALVGVGTQADAENHKKTESEAQTEAPQTEAPTQTEAQTQSETAQSEAAPQTEVDKSMVGTTGFALCDGQINVRASGDTDGEIVGVLNNKNAVQIEDVDENGWYKIKSGNVEGYVAGQYIATGSDAQQIAATSGYTTAEVGAKVLNVRAEKSTDSDVVATATQSDSLEVVQNDGDWLKVCIDHDTYGWVSADYVYASTAYSSGMTVAEESESTAQSEAQAAAAGSQTSDDGVAAAETVSTEATPSETAPADASSDSSASADDSSSDVTYTDTSTASTSESDALYQAYLAAQDAAMHPVSEEDAKQKADAAVSAYQAYLQSLGVSDGTSQTTGSQATQSTEQSTDTSSQPAETAVTSVGTDADALYQAYLQAQDAANHPTDEADAQAKADAAIAAYQAYLNAIGSGSASSQTQETTAETSAPETTAETSAPETSAPETTAETSAPETEAQQTSSLGAQIAAYATQFVGNPYVYGGASLTGGADCSGFTMAVFSHFGISLPHNAAAQSGCGTQVSLSDIQPGDLLFYDNGGGIGHVTIYIGNGQVCHASNERTGITISSISYRNPVCAVRAW